MEIILIMILALMLIVSTAEGITILYGLVLWLGIIVIYSVIKGYSVKEIAKRSGEEMKSIKAVLISFILIGMLSAALPECGCISFISSQFCRLSCGKLFLPAAFLFCAAVSVCTGSAFATAASCGVICVSVGRYTGVPDALICGAVFSGIYVGDRISPVSSSGTLVSQLSDIEMNENTQSMLKRFPIPFAITLIIYVILGVIFGDAHLQSMKNMEMDLSIICLLPVAVILILSTLKVNGRLTLSAAVVCSVVISVFYRHDQIATVLRSLVTGYVPSGNDPFVHNGGGIVSMLKPMVIIMVASCYAAIFEMTDFLKPVNEYISGLKMAQSERNIFISFVTGSIAGSQTMTVILSSLLLPENVKEENKASTLEDTAILVPAMIPWNTAYSVPAAAMAAHLICLPFAFYIYLVPLCTLLKNRSGFRGPQLLRVH